MMIDISTAAVADIDYQPHNKNVLESLNSENEDSQPVSPKVFEKSAYLNKIKTKKDS
jgi:hypothetical protein